MGHYLFISLPQKLLIIYSGSKAWSTEKLQFSKSTAERLFRFICKIQISLTLNFTVHLVTVWVRLKAKLTLYSKTKQNKTMRLYCVISIFVILLSMTSAVWGKHNGRRHKQKDSQNKHLQLFNVKHLSHHKNHKKANAHDLLQFKG